MSRYEIIEGDVLDRLRGLPDGPFHCCVTSPPYWGLRDYQVAGQIGLEPTPEAFVAKMVEVFREVRRVLRDDGTAWVNLGDSYASGDKNGAWNRSDDKADVRSNFPGAPNRVPIPGLKPKDLCGIPWRVALALQQDGWWLRSEIIWCLSGGTWLYVQTDTGGVCLMTVKDLARLAPSTVRLWNGERWTRLLGVSKSPRVGTEIEIVLRTGERISCTPSHKFPTARGLLEAGEIVVGDVLQACQLPEPDHPRDCSIDADAAWFAGLYIAEGSRSGDTIQLAGHVREAERWRAVQRIAAKFGGSATLTENGNTQTIRVYGRVLNAIVDELVTGRTAKDKGFSPSVWRYSNKFLAAMVDGYLSGDGGHDEANKRWRLGFCRNYNLERDLRAACARLGYSLRLNLSSVRYNGRDVPTFRGEIRMERSGHWNEKNGLEVVEIRKARCRNVYDIGVEDDPHLFALASGVLTHNSKPSPMPESVTDRPTKAHEQVFLLTKAARYYYDCEAIREQHATIDGERGNGNPIYRADHFNHHPAGRNSRTVWTIASQPFPEAHFATFPPELPRRCIAAGTSERGCCPECGAGWERVLSERGPGPTFAPLAIAESGALPDGPGTHRNMGGRYQKWLDANPIKTVGWRPTCSCCFPDPRVAAPCRVLDPFSGAGTTGLVACQLGRDYTGIELSPVYAAMSRRRIEAGLRPNTARTDEVGDAGLFAEVQP